MGGRWTRGQAFVGFYALTAMAWLALFPIDFGDLEPWDLFFSGLALGFAGGAALLVFRLELPVLEIGWGVFTYSQLLRFLDEFAEGPEVVESMLPGSVRLVGLAIILLGFARTTERLRLNLTERNERLAVLNRVLRHNLRNDLSSIIGALEYAGERATDDRGTELADKGLEKAWALSELSEKLRRIDRILEYAERRETTTHDLGAVVESTVSEYREAYPAVSFEVETASTALVSATPGLEAAVANLVENACEHNDASDPVVTVTVEPADWGTIALSVHDNGSGIPSHELQPILTGEESALTHGSGVGLWFVLWLVERSGGDIRFEYDGGQRVVVRFRRSEQAYGRLRSAADRLTSMLPWTG